MAIEKYSGRAGSMDPIQFHLVHEGDEEDIGIDLTAVTEVELRLKPKSGGDVKSFKLSDGKIVFEDQVQGIVKWFPSAAAMDFNDGGYDGYFKLTDGAGLTHSVPEGENFEIKVLEGF